MKFATSLMTAAVTCACLISSAATAANYGDDRRWFLSGTIGMATAIDQDFDSGPEAEFGIGKAFSNHFAWQVGLNHARLDADSGGTYERTTLGVGVMLFPFSGFEFGHKNFRPFAQLSANVNDISFVGLDSSSGGIDLGIGFLQSLGSVDFKLEIRQQVDVFEIAHPAFDDENFQTTALLLGVHAPLGAEPLAWDHDEDGDGVADRIDLCPGTAPGVPVNASGCPTDSDYDGVPDFQDNCPNTPAGTPVDVHGCPLDKDGDGIPDSYDACPNTPAGVRVNSQGCGLDGDQDGVPDGVDRCPATPFGVAVDSFGCDIDGDGDGVPTKIDQCPGTLPGARVNSVGCIISQNVEITDVHFEFNEARLLIDSRSVLQKVAESLNNEPNVSVVVEGHTDSIGSDQYNLSLSQRRAQAVVSQLVKLGVNRNRLTAKGYGESKPRADNSTEAGRESNRRVELSIVAR